MFFCERRVVFSKSTPKTTLKNVLRWNFCFVGWLLPNKSRNASHEIITKGQNADTDWLLSLCLLLLLLLLLSFIISINTIYFLWGDLGP